MLTFVWGGGGEYFKDIVDRFEILRYIDLLVIFTLKWNIPKENTQRQTVLLVCCVTTVFNKLSNLGSKLSLALEESWDVSLVLNLMERVIPLQEAIEKFSLRCFPEGNSPFFRVLNISSEADARWWHEWRSWKNNVFCLFCGCCVIFSLQGCCGMVCSVCAWN